MLDHRACLTLVLAALAVGACSSGTDHPAVDNSGILVAPPAPPVAMGVAPVMDPALMAPAMTPTVAAGAGGAVALPMDMAGMGDDPAAMGQAGSTAMHMHQPCIDLEPASPVDATLTAVYEPWHSTGGEVDLLLPKAVIGWMDERLMREGHDGWHLVRKCFGGIPGFGFPGTTMSDLCDREEFKPKEQECEGTTDGYQFLLIHRHMLQELRSAFPTHPDMFAGFAKFPFDAKDVPKEWQDRWGTGWSSQIVQTATTLEDIENELDQFPSEGDLGRYIQCGPMSGSNPASSVHGAMHFKWIVNGSPALLGNQATNTANYMFWKLHGWIDDVWERYRVAKGMKADDPQLKADLVQQCQETHTLGIARGPQSGQTVIMELPPEAGFFHESVRPILEKTCSGCHSGASPEGGMVLGGNVSSADIVKGLVNVQTVRGGQFKRVVPKDPDKSWFYLKPSGNAATAGCTGTCNAQVMPPTGMVTLTSAEQMAIRQWIMDGAPAPTKP